MGYHASMPVGPSHQNSSENEITDVASPQAPLPGKYFLATGKDFPFCRKIVLLFYQSVRTITHFFHFVLERHYRFTIEMAKPRAAEPWVQGYLTAAIFSDKGAVRNIDLTPRGTARLEHGSTYQVVITNPHDLGDKIRKVELNWSHDMNVLEPRSLCILWCNDHLYVKSVTVDLMQMPSRE